MKTRCNEYSAGDGHLWWELPSTSQAWESSRKDSKRLPLWLQISLNASCIIGRILLWKFYATCLLEKCVQKMKCLLSILFWLMYYSLSLYSFPRHSPRRRAFTDHMTRPNLVTVHRRLTVHRQPYYCTSSTALLYIVPWLLISFHLSNLILSVYISSMYLALDAPVLTSYQSEYYSAPTALYLECHRSLND